MTYTITAYWPDTREQPLIRHSAHLADALNVALNFMYSHKHTTIAVRTPDALELIRLWGQPPQPGQDWP